MTAMIARTRTGLTLIAAALSACGSTTHAGDATTNSATGNIGIGQLVASTEIDWTAGAAFGASVTSPPSCTQTTSSNCEVVMCGPLGPDGGIPPDPDAGVITFSGGAIQTPIALSPDADGHYSQVFGVGRIFSAGDSITVSAAGGEIPAFSSPVIAPSDIVVTGPSLGTSEMPIAGAQDLTFTWTGGTVGIVVLELLWNPTSTSSHAVACRFAATAGTGEIPKAQLPAVGMTGHVVVVPTNEIDVSAGTMLVHTGVTATRLTGRFAVQ